MHAKCIIICEKRAIYLVYGVEIKVMSLVTVVQNMWPHDCIGGWHPQYKSMEKFFSIITHENNFHFFSLFLSTITYSQFDALADWIGVRVTFHLDLIRIKTNFLLL